MWLLECDGDLFQDKKLWLMPGSKHIVGRTRSHEDKSDGGHPFHGINNKSVSRKHIIISVADNEEGAATTLALKSTLTIEDCSKFGTVINETKLNPGEEFQAKNNITIKLGNWEHLLTIKWHSVCLTLGSIPKKHLAKEMSSAEKRFRPLDIKISSQFEVSQTTHVVVVKRNIPVVLSGLITGSFIVSEAYIEAIISAATPKSVSSQTNPGLLLAPLEEDFEGNWPDPLKFVPDPSKEPVPRGPEYYRPNPDRKNIFSGMTFVFCAEDQYSNLHIVIGLGGGKSFLCDEYNEGVTSPASFAEYVKDKANGKPFVVVRLQLLEPNLQWKAKFVESSDAILAQRSLPQNELLDAILTNDSTCLRQHLETNHAIVAGDKMKPSKGNSYQHMEANDGSSNSAHKPAVTKLESSPSKANIKRLLFSRKKTRFQGFDSFESGIVDDQKDDVRFDPPNTSILVEDDILEEPPDQPTATRKRPLPDPMDAILPAATAMKKRKIAKAPAVEPDIEVVPQPEPERKRLFKKSTVKRTFGDEYNLDDVESALARQEEEQDKLDEELLKNPMTKKDFQGIRDQIECDEIEVGTRNIDINQPGQWDNRWNGRKNFKKFRKRGQTEEPLRGHKVIVRLEESVRSNGTLGSVRWTGSGTRNVVGQDDDDDSQFRRSTNTSHPDPETIELPPDDYGQEVSTDLNAFPFRNALPVESGSNTPASVTVSQRQGKRPAREDVAPMAKRQAIASRRFGTNDDASSDGSEDEVRFKSFRKRK